MRYAAPAPTGAAPAQLTRSPRHAGFFVPAIRLPAQIPTAPRRSPALIPSAPRHRSPALPVEIAAAPPPAARPEPVAGRVFCPPFWPTFGLKTSLFDPICAPKQPIFALFWPILALFLPVLRRQSMPGSTTAGTARRAEQPRQGQRSKAMMRKRLYGGRRAQGQGLRSKAIRRGGYPLVATGSQARRRHPPPKFKGAKPLSYRQQNLRNFSLKLISSYYQVLMRHSRATKSAEPPKVSDRPVNFISCWL